MHRSRLITLEYRTKNRLSEKIFSTLPRKGSVALDFQCLRYHVTFDAEQKCSAKPFPLPVIPPHLSSKLFEAFYSAHHCIAPLLWFLTFHNFISDRLVIAVRSYNRSDDKRFLGVPIHLGSGLFSSQSATGSPSFSITFSDNSHIYPCFDDVIEATRMNHCAQLPSDTYEVSGLVSFLPTQYWHHQNLIPSFPKSLQRQLVRSDTPRAGTFFVQRDVFQNRPAWIQNLYPVQTIRHHEVDN